MTTIPSYGNWERFECNCSQLWLHSSQYKQGWLSCGHGRAELMSNVRLQRPTLGASLPGQYTYGWGSFVAPQQCIQGWPRSGHDVRQECTTKAANFLWFEAIQNARVGRSIGERITDTNTDSRCTGSLLARSRFNIEPNCVPNHVALDILQVQSQK